MNKPKSNASELNAIYLVQQRQMSRIETRCRYLIDTGEIGRALDLLSEFSGDAVLLRDRYNNNRKQYGMGLLDYSEFKSTSDLITTAALMLAETL